MGMLLCIFLAIIAYKIRSWPVVFVSSIGWTIIALRFYEVSGDLLSLALMISVAIVQIFIIPEGKRK